MYDDQQLVGDSLNISITSVTRLGQVSSAQGMNIREEALGWIRASWVEGQISDCVHRNFIVQNRLHIDISINTK